MDGATGGGAVGEEGEADGTVGWAGLVMGLQDRDWVNGDSIRVLQPGEGMSFRVTFSVH